MTWWKMRVLMAPEGDGGASSGGGNTGGTTPPAGEQAAAATGEAPPAGEQAASTGDGKVTTASGRVLPMSQNTIDKIKRDHHEKGRRAARTELEKRAQAMGYADVDEMLQAAERAKRGGGKQAPKPNGKQGDGKGTGGDGKQAAANGQQQNGNQPRPNKDQRNREMNERIERERRQRLAAEKKAQQAERDKFAAEAMGELKIMALRVGVKDPDYAIELWLRECNAQRSKLDEAAYNAWVDKADEQQFFTELKKSRPYLFEEVVVPATTGAVTSSDGAPPPPGAGKVAEAQANGAIKKAKDMSPEEYEAELKRRGLRRPSM